MKRIITTPGDIITIPIQKDLFAVGLVRFVFKSFKNCISLAIFEEVTNDICANVSFKHNFLIEQMFTGKQLITKGLWPRIDNKATAYGELLNKPNFIVANKLYRGDECLRNATIEELNVLPQLNALGGGLVMTQICEQLNMSTEFIDNWWIEKTDRN